jgi:hypothetical protein
VPDVAAILAGAQGQAREIGMPERLELLNAEAHKGLRMHPHPQGAHPHFVSLVIKEFQAAAITCPIFLAKDASTGQFYAAALFGFEPGEILADCPAGAVPGFRPLELLRQGFFASDENIAIDVAHPRFGTGATRPLFEPDGAPSNMLRQIQRVIGELAAGIDQTRLFIDEMLRLKLIEPIDVSFSFDDGERLSLNGLYTVSRDALNGLDDRDVVGLYRAGHLQAALCMSVSLGQVALFAERRNARLTASR